VRYNESNEVSVDAAPDWGGKAGSTNPEQALAAALSSCQMMTFLALAAKAGWPVASYQDHAVAHLGKNSKGRMSVTRIDLHPVVRFDAEFTVEATKLEAMQERAHRYCFIANTLGDHVQVNIL
jgi:organic hydroperoxide reductase OsmC/OhrA